MGKIKNYVDSVNLKLGKVDWTKLKTESTTDVNGVLDYVSWILLVIGGIALLVSLGGYFFMKGSDDGNLKGWIIGIVITSIVVTAIASYKLIVTVT